MRAGAFLGLTALLAAGVPAPAPARVEAVVVASSLNVRASPGGPVIDWLPRGAGVIVMAVQAEWAQVTWVDESRHLRHGWVALRYLRRGAAEEPGGSRFTTGAGAVYSVSVDDVDPSCHPVAAAGVDACAVTVRFTVRRSGGPAGEAHARVACHAALRGQGRGGEALSDADSRSVRVPVRAAAAAGTVLIEFGWRQRWRAVAVSSARCRITAVH